MCKLKKIKNNGYIIQVNITRSTQVVWIDAILSCEIQALKKWKGRRDLKHKEGDVGVWRAMNDYTAQLPITIRKEKKHILDSFHNLFNEFKKLFFYV